MAWKSGDKLHGGKYTIVRPLGEGRFGITYLVRDRKGESLVIKTLSDEPLNNQQLSPSDLNKLQDKFWQEAVKLAQCQHPHIVKVKEPFKEGQQVCLPMEYIDGVDLEKRAQRILPESEAIAYIQQIAEALTVVHEKNFVHRDVKPANIMLRAGKPHVVLIDFGLARGFDSATTVNSTTADGFAPPELYHVDSEVGAYTDVYSLSATLYELLTGEVPPSAIDRSLGKNSLKPPQEINDKVSDRINRAIVKGMALDANDRPQTVREWLQLLGVRRFTIPWPKDRVLFWTIVSTITAIVSAIGTWVAILKPDPPSPPPPAPAAQIQKIQD